MTIDPICGMEVDETEIKTEFNGKTYYFCATGCKKRFEENPEEFI